MVHGRQVDSSVAHFSRTSDLVNQTEDVFGRSTDHFDEFKECQLYRVPVRGLNDFFLEKSEQWILGC